VFQIFNEKTYNKFVNEMSGFKISDSYPYNLTFDEESHVMRLELACAGFTKEEISVNVVDSTKIHVIIESMRDDSDTLKYQHKGISRRKFDRILAVTNTYDLKQIEVKYKDGLLVIEVPKKKDATVKVEIK
jgi:HSP20 family molecular chaperone IbpA